ncbi:UV-stimulated scaffold protein A, UVSSA [Carpediemonas membranifera]|uniref:UV-stimulated scaffold protein A, UVSSA n=1 Tax=Carpediemonas membranifera TaxID=201153 RepID=A0A8J6B2T9_9EUKA|nr:UV-stimulated scaffold protein A, UVSSA [Carpediemonas membranifera]|eukprot:KAG9391772.1 UV-stimulated scaffold protein A, UVSSA [Carpediemonas membranifera]
MDSQIALKAIPRYVNDVIDSSQPLLQDELKYIKRISKKNVLAARHAVKCALFRMQDQKANVRMNAIELLNYLFMNIAATRPEIVGKLSAITTLAVLKPPKSATKDESRTLAMVYHHTLGLWVDAHGVRFPTLASARVNVGRVLCLETAPISRTPRQMYDRLSKWVDSQQRALDQACALLDSHRLRLHPPPTVLYALACGSTGKLPEVPADPNLPTFVDDDITVQYAAGVVTTEATPQPDFVLAGRFESWGDEIGPAVRQTLTREMDEAVAKVRRVHDRVAAQRDEVDELVRAKVEGAAGLKAKARALLEKAGGHLNPS